MLCRDLQHLHRVDVPSPFCQYPRSFSASALHRGSCFTEPNRAEFVLDDLFIYHCGRDASIMNMLGGGNGFPPAIGYNYAAASIFDLGTTQETRDMRSFRMWSNDLNQCRLDKSRGAVS